MKQFLTVVGVAIVFIAATAIVVLSAPTNSDAEACAGRAGFLNPMVTDRSTVFTSRCGFWKNMADEDLILFTIKAADHRERPTTVYVCCSSKTNCYIAK